MASIATAMHEMQTILSQAWEKEKRKCHVTVLFSFKINVIASSHF